MHRVRRNRSIALAIMQSFVFLSSMTITIANADPYLPSSNGDIVIEAENFDLNVARGGRDWVTDNTPGFIGDSAMRASPDTWKSVKSDISNNSPRMDYDVHYAARTTVYVWVRGLGTSSAADSIWIGVDGVDTQAIRVDPTRGGWGWEVARQPLVVPAGTHTINVWMREDGTIVDRLILSPSMRTPVGDGGEESLRSGDIGGGSGNNENTWPIANDDTFSVVNDGTNHLLRVLADNGSGPDFDPDGDAISISEVSEPSNVDSSVTIDANSDGIYFTPGAGIDRTETFDYKIDDGNGGTGSATVSVSVTSADSGGNSGSGNIFEANPNGQVVIEAEHHERKVRLNGRDWVADFTTGFVGDSAMRASPDSWRSVKNDIAANSPRMDYSVNFASSELVNVWVRGLGPSGSADSVWVGLNGDDENALQIDTPRGTWGWETSNLKLRIPAGVHTVNVWMREDGTIIDRLLLTPSSTRPSGRGPDESSRGDGSTQTDPPTVNSPPRISGSPPSRVAVGALYSFTPTASDADGDPLTFSIDGRPPWLNFNSSTGRIHGTPGNSDRGTYDDIVIYVSDGQNAAHLERFSIDVVDADQGSINGAATLSWTAPTENEDGSRLTDLAGYRIYWGVNVGNYPNSVTINDPAATEYVVEDLAPDTYYFVSTSFNSAGIESGYSNRATKTVP